MTAAQIIWHLIGAWFVLVAIGSAYFMGHASGRAVGELIGEDRVRKIYEPFSRYQDYGEQ